MADFSHIEQNYENNRDSKSNRDAYKIILLSRINQDRADLCQACGDLKSGFSPAKIIQNFVSANAGNSVIAGKLFDIVKSYPYLSLHMGKTILKLGKIGSKSKLIRVLAIIGIVKIITAQFSKDQPGE